MNGLSPEVLHKIELNVNYLNAIMPTIITLVYTDRLTNDNIFSDDKQLRLLVWTI